MDDYEIEESSLNRIIRYSYDLLGLQSFFTVGPDECGPGLFSAGQPHRRQPARFTPICKKDLSGPRWSIMMI